MRPKFVAEPNGSLLVYHPPRPDLDYCIGVDSSEGVQGGDYSVAQVIEMVSMAQVATWRGLYAPHDWGHMVSLLGLWYNEALLTVETDPSAHGRDACHRAAQLGYPRFYLRERLDKVQRTTTDVLGWRTDKKTKQSLMNALRDGVAQGLPINDKRTLHELSAMRYDDKSQPVSQTHDDTVMALGMAYMGRAWAFQHDDVRQVTRKKRLTLAEKEWQAWDALDDRRGEVPVYRSPGILNPNGA